MTICFGQQKARHESESNPAQLGQPMRTPNKPPRPAYPAYGIMN